MQSFQLKYESETKLINNFITSESKILYGYKYKVNYYANSILMSALCISESHFIMEVNFI